MFFFGRVLECLSFGASITSKLQLLCVLWLIYPWFKFHFPYHTPKHIHEWFSYINNSNLIALGLCSSDDEQGLFQIAHFSHRPGDRWIQRACAGLKSKWIAERATCLTCNASILKCGVTGGFFHW